jgi:hypothetical protein
MHSANGAAKGVMNVSIFHNTTDSPGSFALGGLALDIGAVTGDDYIVNLVAGSATDATKQNNFSAGDPGNFNDVLLSLNIATSVVNLSRNGSANATVAGVIQDDNPTGPPTVSVGGTFTLVNTLPTLPPVVAPLTLPFEASKIVEIPSPLGAAAKVANGELRIENGELGKTAYAQIEIPPALGEMASADLEIRPAMVENGPSTYEIVAEIAKRASSEISPTVYSANTVMSGETITINGSGSGFTLPAGKGVTITFDATVAPVGTIPANTFSISNQGSTSGTGFGPILTDGDLVTAGIQPTVVTIVQPETIAKAFNPTSVTLGAQSTLTFTLTNANPATAATGVTFTDVFPTTPGPMTVASPVTASTTCAGGTLTNNTGGILTPGDPGIKLAGGTLAANGATCTVSVKVATNLAGTYNNTSGNVASNEGAAGLTASASLTASPLTASGVSVSGRVIQGEGRGIRNARVVITDATGISRTVMTGSRGSFRFEDVMAGETYTISVAARRFTIIPRVITVTDELTDVDFVAEPYQ